MRLSTFASAEGLIIEPDPRPGPKGESALALLQAVYRDPDTPLSVRIKCASRRCPTKLRSFQRQLFFQMKTLPRASSAPSCGAV